MAFDGTGYGTDGNIWGGEFLIADYAGFRRAGHLETCPSSGVLLPSASPTAWRWAICTPWSVMISRWAAPLRRSNRGACIIKNQLKRRINSPLTSSAGRLFDAVAALVGLRGEINYEAQAAIDLEMLAYEASGETGEYPFAVAEQEGVSVLKVLDLFSAIIDDLRHRTPAAVIATRFHNTVARMIAAQCRIISFTTGLREVALSGGVFQNRLLFRLALDGLRRAGFEVLTHRLVPCNDAGISLGQAAIASFAGA